MKEEMFYEGELIQGYNLWDFSEDVQERIKNIFRETGFDKKINMETAFIEREEPEYITEIQDFLLDAIAVNTAPKNNFFTTASGIKPLPLEKSEINNFALDGKVKFSDKIEHIHLSKLSELDDSINCFSLPENEDFLNLMESIERHGVLNPLLVIKYEESDQYMVLCGNSRRIALNALFNETGNEEYLYAPCIVLDGIKDPQTLQSIVIETNLSYRKLSKEEQIKAVLILDGIITKSKKYKNEINITDRVAEKAGISRTTANTIRGFRNLSPKALDLLYKAHINRSTARLLSMKDHETQDLIIDGLGNQINDIRKLRAMMSGPAKSAYDNELRKTVPDTWERKMKRTLEMVPNTTKITLYVASKEVEGVLNALLPLRGKAASKYQAFKDNEINKHFRVVLNEDHMEQYLKAGRVTQETLDKIRSGEFKEVIKYA